MPAALSRKPIASAGRLGSGPALGPQSPARLTDIDMDHQGRLLDHVHLRVSDLAASRRFYRAALEAIGRLEAFGEAEGCFFADEFYVDKAEGRVSHVHLAFQARSEDEVRRFHAMTLSAGGRDHGGPGPRHYHPGYYAAFVLDPDGNNIEAVYHGPTQRSADSVEVTRL